MKTTLSWGYGAKRYRVWWDEPSGYEYTSADATILRLLPAEHSLRPAKQVAVEFFIPAGPMALYGALGACFQPAQGDNLKLVVPTVSSTINIEGESLAGSWDRVHLGLLEEFGEATADTLERKLVEVGFSSAGVMTVCAAACSDVGSSIVVFRILSSIVSQLMARDDSACEDIRAIAESAVWEITKA
jgi:hypothetical protein